MITITLIILLITISDGVLKTQETDKSAFPAGDFLLGEVMIFQRLLSAERFCGLLPKKFCCLYM